MNPVIYICREKGFQIVTTEFDFVRQYPHEFYSLPDGALANNSDRVISFANGRSVSYDDLMTHNDPYTLMFEISDQHMPNIIPPEMRVPDLLEPITAWRGWKLDQSDGKLHSYGVSHVWKNTEVKALCLRDASHNEFAPVEGCKCGYYAFKGILELEEQIPRVTQTMNPKDEAFLPNIVWGKVKLWGKVVEHERGFRAEYMKVQNMFFGYERSLSDKMTRSLILGEYGIEAFPMTIVNDELELAHDIYESLRKYVLVLDAQRRMTSSVQQYIEMREAAGLEINREATLKALDITLVCPRCTGFDLSARIINNKITVACEACHNNWNPDAIS